MHVTCFNWVAKYVYDAWGNHKTFALNSSEWVDISSQTAYNENSSLNEKLAILNPFRYRSYYFDIETGFYYLQSRYYDPQVGRFLSLDSLEYLDPETIHGLNLFAYCLNNPVTAIDPSGNFAVFLACVIAGLIAGAIIGGTAGGIVAYNLASETGATGWELVGWTILGIFGGTAAGGAIGAAIGAGVGGLLSGIFALGSVIGGGSTFALIGGGTLSGAGSLAIASVSIGSAIAAGTGIGVLGAGLVFMSKPNSGRIRYSDGTGTNPDGSKMSQEEAEMAYKNSKDPVYGAFDFIDTQSISQLAVDFVKDSLFDIMRFVDNVKSIMK